MRYGSSPTSSRKRTRPFSSGSNGVPTSVEKTAMFPPTRRPFAFPADEFPDAVLAVDRPLARREGRRLGDSPRGALHDDLSKGRERVFAHRRIGDRPMKGDEAREAVDCVERRRDVAVPDERLRVLPDRLVVEVRQDSRGSIASANAPDGVHFRVGKGGVQVGGPLRVGPREVPELLPGVLHQLRREAERSDDLDRDFVRLVVEGRRGRTDQGNRVALLERLREDGFRRLLGVARQRGLGGLRKPGNERGERDLLEERASALQHWPDSRTAPLPEALGSADGSPRARGAPPRRWRRSRRPSGGRA